MLRRQAAMAPLFAHRGRGLFDLTENFPASDQKKTLPPTAVQDVLPNLWVGDDQMLHHAVAKAARHLRSAPARRRHMYAGGRSRLPHGYGHTAGFRALALAFLRLTACMACCPPRHTTLLQAPQRPRQASETGRAAVRPPGRCSPSRCAAMRSRPPSTTHRQHAAHAPRPRKHHRAALALYAVLLVRAVGLVVLRQRQRCARGIYPAGAFGGRRAKGTAGHLVCVRLQQAVAGAGARRRGCARKQRCARAPMPPSQSTARESPTCAVTSRCPTSTDVTCAPPSAAQRGTQQPFSAQGPQEAKGRLMLLAWAC